MRPLLNMKVVRGKTTVFPPRPFVNIAVNKIDIKWAAYHFSHARIVIVWSLLRYQQWMMTSSAERKPSDWDKGTMCEDRPFYCNLWIRYVLQEMRQCIYCRDCLCSSSSSNIIFAYFPPIGVTREINTKIIFPWVHKQFVTGLQALLYTSVILKKTGILRERREVY